MEALVYPLVALVGLLAIFNVTAVSLAYAWLIYSSPRRDPPSGRGGADEVNILVPPCPKCMAEAEAEYGDKRQGGQGDDL